MFAGELILRLFTVAGFIDAIADGAELAFKQQPVGGSSAINIASPGRACGLVGNACGA